MRSQASILTVARIAGVRGRLGGVQEGGRKMGHRCVTVGAWRCAHGWARREQQQRKRAERRLAEAICLARIVTGRDQVIQAHWISTACVSTIVALEL